MPKSTGFISRSHGFVRRQGGANRTGATACTRAVRQQSVVRCSVETCAEADIEALTARVVEFLLFARSQINCSVEAARGAPNDRKLRRLVQILDTWRASLAQIEAAEAVICFGSNPAEPDEVYVLHLNPDQNANVLLRQLLRTITAESCFRKKLRKTALRIYVRGSVPPDREETTEVVSRSSVKSAINNAKVRCNISAMNITNTRNSECTNSDETEDWILMTPVLPIRSLSV
ncbi:MAG: hypothetical protein MHM6MM_000290 [Cercozoa sp. M6MM]